MIGLLVIAMMVGVLWIIGSVVGLVFKLAFGLIGGLFGLLAGGIGLLVGGLVMLLVLPIIALSLLPLCMPALLLFGLIWAIAHVARRPAVTTTSR